MSDWPEYPPEHREPEKPKRDPIELIRSVPSLLEKEWTAAELAASKAFMEQIQAWCEYKNYQGGKPILPFGILLMGYGNGVWFNCIRAALTAAEKATSKTE